MKKNNFFKKKWNLKFLKSEIWKFWNRKSENLKIWNLIFQNRFFSYVGKCRSNPLQCCIPLSHTGCMRRNAHFFYLYVRTYIHHTKKLALMCFFCDDKYITSMPITEIVAPDCSQWHFFWIYWYLRKPLFLNGFLNIQSWIFCYRKKSYLTGFPKLFNKKNICFRTFLTKKISVGIFSEYHLILKICKYEHFGEQNT